jgi:hypothetical protein
LSDVPAPQPGDFALVDIRQPMGYMIRFLQWENGDGFGDYEHVALYVGNGEFLEATPKNGIMRNKITEYPPELMYWSTGIINPSAAQRDAIVKVANSYIGVDYSFLDYQALVAHRLHLWAPGLKHYIASTRHMICSQFIDQCYIEGGLPLFTDGRWPGYVTPGDLWRLLESTKP